ncbi:MAG: tetratricopeptide repeat protein [Myxococcales bacterium]|nr:tetratricopeptide repeat protein [Myxococcales bacterium]
MPVPAAQSALVAPPEHPQPMSLRDDFVAGRPAGPPPSAPPSPTPPKAREAIAIEAPSDAALRLADEDSLRFFLREAEACGLRQPERAAAMRVEAAGALERSGATAADVFAELEAAVAACRETPLLPSIRRITQRLGNVDRALELGEAELSLGGENATRTAVLIEMAAAQAIGRGKAVDALDLLAKALELQPGNVTALVLSAALQRRLQRFAALAQTLTHLVDAITVPIERARYLYALGALYESSLRDEESAIDAYSRAVDADNEQLPALLALCTLLERGGRHPELARRLEQWASLATDPAWQARLLSRAGVLHLEASGDLEAAARCFSGAVRAAPADSAALARLAEVHAAADQPGETVSVLQQLLGHVEDQRGRAALSSRIGWLYRARIGDDDAAIGAYLQALETRPGYVPAMQALGTMYQQRGDLEALLTIHGPEIEGSANPRERAARCIEVGAIHERLDNAQPAIDAYRRALEIAAGGQLAFWRLTRLLRAQKRYAELADALAAQIERTSDIKTRHALLVELAQLQAERLQQPDQAIETLSVARSVDQTRSASLALERQLTARGRYPELVELLLDEAKDTTAPEEAQARRLQAAEILDDVLGEHDRALEIYHEVLRRDGRCVEAVRAAGRVYHRLGRWSELVELHRHEIGMLDRGAGNTRLLTPKAGGSEADDAERGRSLAALYCRIGRVQDEQLGDTSAAIEAYLDALDADSRSAPAIAALERLLRRAERWGELVSILERLADSRTAPQTRADALCRAAEIAELRLSDMTQSARLYRAAAEACPDMLEPLFGLLRVQVRERDDTAQLETLTQMATLCENVATRAVLDLWRARVAELQLDRATVPDIYERIIASSPYGPRLEIEHTRALRTTFDRAKGDEHAPAARALGVWLVDRGSRCQDLGLATACFMEALYISELGGDGGARIGGIDTMRAAISAHELRPQDPAVVWALERALLRAGEHGALAGLYEQSARLEIDASGRAFALSRAALSWAAAGDAEGASRSARACLNIDSQNLAALMVLSRIAEDKREFSGVAALCDQIAVAAQHKQSRLESAVRAADLWADAVGDEARALVSLKLALGDDPTEAQAFDRAEDLMRRRKQFAEVSQLFSQRIKATSDRKQKADLLRRHATLLRKDLDDTGRAIAELNELLALEPNDVDTLADLAELYCQKQRWSDATATLSLLVERSDDEEVNRRARLFLAELYADQLHEPRRAREVLDGLLEVDPRDIKAKRLLVKLAIGEGEWQIAHQRLQEIAAEKDEEHGVWALSQLAEVARIGLRDPELRVQYEREALAEAAGNDKALMGLVSFYQQRGELTRLLSLGQQVLESTSRADVVLPLRVAVTRLLLDHRQDAARALEYARANLLARPNEVDVQLLFARALEVNNQRDAAVGGYRKVLGADATNVDAYRGLVRIFGRAQRPQLAACASSALDLLGAADTEERMLARTLEEEVVPPGAIRLAAIPLPADLRAVAALFEQATPYLGALHEVERGRMLPPEHPASVTASRIAAALGVGEVSVQVGNVSRVSSTPGEPIQLVMSDSFVQRAREGAFRFWTAHAICSAATAGTLLRELDDRTLQRLVIALCNPRPDDPMVQPLRKKVARALPRKVRKQLEGEVTPPTPPDIWNRYRAAERERADRAALLICRSPRIAAHELLSEANIGFDSIGAHDGVTALLRYSVSDEHARLMHSVWLRPDETRLS